MKTVNPIFEPWKFPGAVLLLLVLLSCPGQGSAQSIIPLADSNIVNLSLRGEAIRLIDEPTLAGNPINQKGGKPKTNFDPSYNKLFQPVQVMIHLFSEHHLDQLWFYDSFGADTIHFYTGVPGQWRYQGHVLTNSFKQWRAFAIQDTSNFLLLEFNSPQAAISEIVLYGEDLQGRRPHLPRVPRRRQPTMDTLMGINGFVDDPRPKLAQVAGTLREYHNWDWDEGRSDREYQGYPNSEFSWAPSAAGGWNFDHFYGSMKERGVSVVPCLKGSPEYLRDSLPEDAKPSMNEHSADNPMSYRAHADYLYQFAARYGQRSVANEKLKLASGQNPRSGLGLIHYVENWNEPDKWWRGREGFFRPFEMAAMCSADWDGHEKSLGAEYGLRNADPSMKLVMGGLARLDLDYIEAMRLWALHNREDGEFPADVLNFHHYSNDSGGQDGKPSRGISPEADSLRQRVAKLVRYRDKYLPDREIWISEFGYDTNPRSVQGVRPIGNFDTEEVQAQWLCRSFLELAAAGIDRAQLYMLRDVNAENPNKYNSSGVTREKWNQHESKKAYYYLSSMRGILKGYRFEKEIPTEDSKLRHYRFQHHEQDSVLHVLWSATEEAREISGHSLHLPGVKKAKVLRLQADRLEPWSSTLAVNGKSLKINIKERPVFVKVGNE